MNALDQRLDLLAQLNGIEFAAERYARGQMEHQRKQLQSKIETLRQTMKELELCHPNRNSRSSSLTTVTS